MKELKKSIESAFKYISLIPVYGDNVDIMKLARDNLKKAFDLADKIEKGDENQDG